MKMCSCNARARQLAAHQRKYQYKSQRRSAVSEGIVHLRGEQLSQPDSRRIRPSTRT